MYLFIYSDILSVSIHAKNAKNLSFCSFWYHLHDPFGISSRLALSLDTNSTSVVLWEIKQGQTNGWVNATVRIGNRPKGSKVSNVKHFLFP